MNKLKDKLKGKKLTYDIFKLLKIEKKEIEVKKNKINKNKFILSFN
jgi:hypothetical protein